MKPLLFSFRRCPYAIRARLALRIAKVDCEHREVSLKAKPPELLEASPKGTVPVLVFPDGGVIDESLDIMRWALKLHDPQRWLAPGPGVDELIAENDGSFKFHLDRYKYPHRYEGAIASAHRDACVVFLQKLEARLTQSASLFRETPSLADYAIVPFVRQYAAHAPEWFTALPLPRVHTWLGALVGSELFAAVMAKE